MLNVFIIIGRYILLQQELKRLGTELMIFSITNAEFVRIATEKVDMSVIDSQRAIELFHHWGIIYLLSGGSIILDPRRLTEVFSCLITQSVKKRNKIGDAASGILHHDLASLQAIWTEYDNALYPQFLQLLHDNDLAYPLNDRNGNPLGHHGTRFIF
jgi:hypothetical protein